MNQSKQDWREIEFGAFAEFNPKVKLQNGGKFPFIEMEDITPGEKYVVSKKFKKYTGGGSKFQNKDVLFARITPCLEHGKIAQVKELESGYGFGSTEFFIFRNRPNISDGSFIYYLSRSRTIRKNAENSMFGASGRQRADKDFLGKVKIRIPKRLEEQKTIAKVLSNYDNLIEINKKKIEILEKMAEMIYNEWFVKFKFPGYENVKKFFSKEGNIPKGWTIKSLFEISDVKYGFPFNSTLFSERNKDNAPVIRIRDLKNGRTKTFSSESVDESYLVKNADILVGMDGDFNIAKWGGGEAYLNQRVVRFRPKIDRFSRYYLFLGLKPKINYYNNIIVGTTVSHLSDGDLKSIKLLVPSKDILFRIYSTLEPLYKLEVMLKVKNQTLQKTRDLLLPKLISGQIDISELDIKISEVET